ncbi:MAG: GNAT family N-acetyltransferase [Lachnospiraceae bacterium]|nr:GNAT family N-acetyltransferase [Ruminococcus sp.]MCM1275949.1 GNAT family N-acetyltransferase [Lachnospiraceae bacterium]
MKIIDYSDEYRERVIAMILHIQNGEAGIGLPLEEQPDLLDVKRYYLDNGGRFWLAVEGGELVGTVALMNKGGGNGVLKKFFVRSDMRGKGLGLALYGELLKFARGSGFKRILLDTPSVAERSHRFYERAGFRRVDEPPFEYDFPDRNSYLYLLEL